MRYGNKHSCCYKCPKRTQWCHANCPDHALEREEDKIRLEEARKMVQANDAIHTPAFERRKRNAMKYTKK